MATDTKKPSAKMDPSQAELFRTHLDERDVARDAGEELPEADERVKPVLGMLEAAMIAAYADGELDDAEEERVLDIASKFLDGEWKKGQIRALVEDFEGALEEEGAEARIEAIAGELDADYRKIAFQLACQVAILSGGSNEEEDSVLWQIAESFEIGEEEAQEIYSAAEAWAA